MPRLVAIVAKAGAEGRSTATELRRAWDGGDAVLVVDHRLPPAAQQALCDRMGVGGEVGADDALVLATSGTTGEPRGVVLTHQALRAAADASSRRLDVDPQHDVWLAGLLPLNHVGGLSVVTRALLTGTPLAFEGPATLTSVVPTQLHRGDVDPTRFRKILLGGSADWKPDERPDNVVLTYGMTETGGGVVYDGVPLDGVEMRVDEADGQIHLRGPSLLRCYRDGADPKTPDGWLPTGDSGAVGADGRLTVFGRMHDVIVTGGEKVWPDAVERALRACTAIKEVAVAGRVDDEWGQRVVAFVVPADPGDPPTLEQLRGTVKETMPAYAAPKELVLVESLPRTALGKVRRGEL